MSLVLSCIAVMSCIAVIIGMWLLDRRAARRRAVRVIGSEVRVPRSAGVPTKWRREHREEWLS